MTTLNYTRRLMHASEAGDGSITFDFTVKISPKGLVTVNGDPVGYADTDPDSGLPGLGLASVYQQFGQMFIEVRKMMRAAEVRRRRAAKKAAHNSGTPAWFPVIKEGSTVVAYCSHGGHNLHEDGQACAYELCDALNLSHNHLFYLTKEGGPGKTSYNEAREKGVPIPG